MFGAGDGDGHFEIDVASLIQLLFIQNSLVVCYHEHLHILALADADDDVALGILCDVEGALVAFGWVFDEGDGCELVAWDGVI